MLPFSNSSKYAIDCYSSPTQKKIEILMLLLLLTCTIISCSSLSMEENNGRSPAQSHRDKCDGENQQEQCQTRSNKIFQMSRSNYKTRRVNEILQVVEEVPLIPGYGTHIAYVYVGTPPQRVSVIVDTGSHYTAFPCKGCDRCGDHLDAYWDYDASSTSRIPLCDECHILFSCDSIDNKCLFSQHYSEGSSWSAFQVFDNLYLGMTTIADTPAADEKFGLDFMFGCIFKQTGLFNSQLADGIMGMSASPSTIVDQLYELNVLEHESFSLCLSEDGGTMVIGGSESLLWSSEMQYTENLKASGWFTVELLDILVGSQSINVDSSIFQRGNGVIVDSGTTDTYLPRACMDGFDKIFNKLSSIKYSNDNLKLSEEQLENLPIMTFVFRGNIKVIMRPNAYFSPADTDGKYFSPSIHLEESVGAVLGANFMRDHDVLFDQENKRVGFADANCDWFDLQNAKKQQTLSPTPHPNVTLTSSPVGAPLSTAKPTLASAMPVPTLTPNNLTYSSNSASQSGSVRETQTPTAFVICNSSTEEKIIEPCNAVCSETASYNYTESGFEVWEISYSAGEPLNESCTEKLPRTEQRPCTVECSPKQSSGTESCVSYWSECNVFCEQSRFVQDLTRENSCETEKRSCHIGPICPESAQGLTVSGSLKVYLKSTLEWSLFMSDCIADALSRGLSAEGDSLVQPGDIEIYPATEIQNSVKVRHLMSTGFHISFGVHLYSGFDEALAMTIKSRMLTSDFSSILKTEISNDVEDRFDDQVDSLLLESSSVSILNSYDKSIYRFSDEAVVGSMKNIDKSSRLTLSGLSTLAISFLIFMIAVIVFLFKRSSVSSIDFAPVRQGRSNKYRIVGKDESPHRMEFEMAEAQLQRSTEDFPNREPVS